MRTLRSAFQSVFFQTLHLADSVVIEWYFQMLLTWILLITSVIAAEYFYIIVGGGTSGLAVANRLSEDPDVSVLIIEAGDSVYDNPNVTDISRIASTLNTPFDWAYQTTEQSFGGREQVIHAGKALGGSSVLNGKDTDSSQDEDC